jgi:Carboxypeptidase regulatory-like domain
MTCRLAHAVLASMFIATATTLAGAQGSATSSLSGVVKDSGGDVIPGASVVVTSNGTGTRFETITNSTGAY